MGKVDLALSELLLDIYRAAREQPTAHFQEAVLRSIKAHISFDSARWGAGNFDNRAVHANVLHLHNEDADSVPAYEEIKEQDLAVHHITALSVQGKKRQSIRFCADTLYAGSASAGMRDYTTRFEHRNTLISAATEPASKRVHWMSLYRADEGKEFALRDQHLLYLVMPHCEEARIQNWIAHLPSDSAASRRVRFVRAVADPGGLIYFATPGFYDLLTTELPVVPELLPKDLIAGLTAGRPYLGRAVIIEARSEAGMLMVRARARSPADDLSPREAEVARLTVSGKTYKEVARDLRLAPATVRTLMQRIHQKLGTCNMTEWVHLIEAVR